MGVVKNLTIEVNENPNCYKLDEQGCLKVSGNVSFVLEEATDVKYFKIVCKGKSLLGWIRGIHNGVNLAHDLLFKKKCILVSPEGTGSKTLLVGSHTFPFVFTIHPTRHLPSTYFGNHGSISYKVYAQIETVGNVFTKKKWEVKLLISLYNPMRVNMSQFANPVTFSRTLTSSTMANPGTISMSGTIDKEFLPLRSDEQLTITLTISNMLKKPITPVAYLQEYILYHAPNGSRKQSLRALCQMDGNAVLPNVEGQQCQLKLGPIREVTPGTVDSLSNISISYIIYIKLKGTIWFMRFPLTVGVGM